MNRFLLLGAGIAAALLPFCRRALAQDAAVAPTVVELPPMLVELNIKSKPWLYGELPGFVVLSRCTESTTLEFLRGEYRALQLVDLIVPANFRAKFSHPRLVVLSTREQTATTHQTLIKDVTPVEPAPRGPAVLFPSAAAASRPPSFVRPGSGALPPVVRYLPNLGLDDTDSTVTFALLDEATFDGDRMRLSAGGVHQLIARRTPALPHWLVSGLEHLVRDSDFEGDRVAVGPLLWFSGREQQGFAADRYYPRTLYPMREILESAGPADDDDSESAARWRAQAGLFVRWALQGGDEARSAVFWKFAERAAGEGVTEALVREAFNLGYSDLRDTLSDYLANPDSSPGWRIAGRIERVPTLWVREARAEQIAWLRGEWERLEVVYVAARHPDFLEEYAGQAERDLRTSYGEGVRDPQFLGTFGLFLADQRKPGEALPILEIAAGARDARQRVLYEVSRLRFEAAVAPGGRLSADQVAGILSFIPRARQLRPANAAVYELIAATWLLSDERISAEDLAAIDEGVRLFPRNQVLAAARRRLAQ